MSIMYVPEESGYVLMPQHHLKNPELTLAAKGLLSQLLSMPGKKEYSFEDLACMNAGGADSIYAAIQELKQVGYVKGVENKVFLTYPEEAAEPPERGWNGNYNMDAVRAYEEVIKDNIEYDYLLQNPQITKEQLDEIVSLMLETVCTRRKMIRVAGDDYPAELVKAKLMKLNSGHIQFVFECMRQNTTKIRNIKKYLLAVLFNAPNTIDSYYTALVNHDMYGG